MNNVSGGPLRRHRDTGARIAKVAAVGVIASLALAACAAPAADPSVVTLWYTPYTGDASVEEWGVFNIEPFEARFTDATVDAVVVPGESSIQKQAVALAAGTGPDIVGATGSTTAIPLFEAGYLADLGDTAAENNWANKILPWALDLAYIDGKLVAIPTSYETLVLYYNKTLFDDNGWEPPMNRASLEKLAGEMQAKGIIPFAAGNADYQPATEWLVSTYLNQVAGPSSLYAAIKGEIPWTDPSIEASIQMMKDDFEAGWYAGGVKQYFTTQDTQKYTQLADGEAGMFVSGSWEMDGLGAYFGVDGNTNEWAWAPLPPLADGVPSGIFPLAVGGTASVNAGSKSIENAKNYLSWLFDDTASMWDRVEAGVGQPLPVKYEESDVPAGVDARYAAQYAAINDASEAGLVGYVTWTSMGPKSQAFVVDNIDKVINGDQSVADFCAGLDEAFVDDRAKGLVPPAFTTND